MAWMGKISPNNDGHQVVEKISDIVWENEWGMFDDCYFLPCTEDIKETYGIWQHTYAIYCPKMGPKMNRSSLKTIKENPHPTGFMSSVPVRVVDLWDSVPMVPAQPALGRGGRGGRGRRRMRPGPHDSSMT